MSLKGLFYSQFLRIVKLNALKKVIKCPKSNMRRVFTAEFFDLFIVTKQ